MNLDRNFFGKWVIRDTKKEKAPTAFWFPAAYLFVEIYVLYCLQKQ